MSILEKEKHRLSLLEISFLRISAGKDSLIIRISHSIFRYAVYELEYHTDDGRTESKILFILYAPDVCDSAEKFLYASTKEKVKKKVSPVNKEL